MAVIEKVNPMPLYLQLKNQIKKEIRTGLLKAGDKLPSEAQLQKEYGMSRVTVRNAMEELAAEGYIIKVQGKGSFVANSDMLRLPIGVTSFSEDARSKSDINNPEDRSRGDPVGVGSQVFWKQDRRKSFCAEAGA